MKRALAVALAALFFDVVASGQQLDRFREAERTASLISNVLASTQISASLELNGKCGPGTLVPDLPSVSPAEALRTQSGRYPSLDVFN